MKKTILWILMFSLLLPCLSACGAGQQTAPSASLSGTQSNSVDQEPEASSGESGGASGADPAGDAEPSAPGQEAPAESGGSGENGDTSGTDAGDGATSSQGAESGYLPPVLIRSGSFTGTTPLENNNDYNGGYYYADQTEDGQTIIINCCFTTTQTGSESQEDYIRRVAREIGGQEPQGLTITENETHTARIAYPVRLLSWQTGEDGDARQWDAFFFQTDTHTYLYAFDTAAEAAPELEGLWQEVFGELNLVDLNP